MVEKDKKTEVTLISN